MCWAAMELNAVGAGVNDGAGAADNGAAVAGLTMRAEARTAKDEAIRERFTAMRVLSNDEWLKTS